MMTQQQLEKYLWGAASALLGTMETGKRGHTLFIGKIAEDNYPWVEETIEGLKKAWKECVEAEEVYANSIKICKL